MDIFSLDSILELIDKSKSKIKKELDMKILDNDKLSLESDNLLKFWITLQKQDIVKKNCSIPNL